MALKLLCTCRVCLAEATNLQSVFHSSNSLNDINEKIQLCAGVNIAEDDGLPSSICGACVEELKVAYNFVEKCRKSDLHLRNMIAEVKTEKLEPDIPVDIKEELKVEINDDYDDGTSDIDLPFLDESKISTKSDENYVNKYSKIKDKISAKKNKVKNKVKIQKRIKIKYEQNKTDVRKGPIKCETCGLAVQSQSAMIIHLRTHTGEKPYSCSSCDLCFAQKSTLRNHILRRHLHKKIRSGKDYTCENCGKTFACSTNLKIHLRIHTGEMPYECKFCQKRFMQLGSLISHKRRHTGEKPFSCATCNKAFVELTHLKRHQSVHSVDRPYICNICGKGVKSPFALKQHIKLHTNKKDHVCDQCGMSFMIKGNLDSHLRVVHSDRSGQCTICRKLCSNLADHMVNHTGEKPFQCEVCSKRFAHNRGLVTHSRQHTAANKFKCNVEGCNRSFYAQWVLECHIFKHTGHTPFVCKHCSKGFLRVCHLTKHMKLNHPNEGKKIGSTKQ